MIINNHTTTRQELFITLYKKAFPSVARFVQKTGGNLEDTKDIFQDGLLVFYEKAITRGSGVLLDETAYLVGICKHLWYKKLQTDKRMQHVAQLPEWKIENDPPPVSESILQLIEHSGKKCLELLQSFYFEKCSMKEIAQLFGFAGERSATAQKYKCLEKVRATIKNKSLVKEDFYE